MPHRFYRHGKAMTNVREQRNRHKFGGIKNKCRNRHDNHAPLANLVGIVGIGLGVLT